MLSPWGERRGADAAYSIASSLYRPCLRQLGAADEVTVMRLSHDGGLAEPRAFHARPRKILLRNVPVGERPRLFFSESAIRGRRCMNGVGRLLCLGQRDGLSALHVKVATRRQCCCQRMGYQHYRQFQQLTTSWEPR